VWCRFDLGLAAVLRSEKRTWGVWILTRRSRENAAAGQKQEPGYSSREKWGAARALKL